MFDYDRMKLYLSESCSALRHLGTVKKNFLILQDMWGPTGIHNGHAVVVKAHQLSENDTAEKVAAEIHKEYDWISLYLYDKENNRLRYAAGKFTDLGLPLVNL